MAKATSQLKPQNEGGNYSTKNDKKKKAKPAGYRYTDKLAKGLKKDPQSRPTTADIEKYLGKKPSGKYVYSERRKDKSDVNPKAKLAKGGQTAPQNEGGNYSRSADRTKTAKPVGYRFTNKLADKLGKKPTTRPTTAEVEKYSGGKRGLNVYKETRMDKTDIKPKDRFAKGGVAEHGLRQGDKITHVEGRYMFVKNGDKTFVIDIELGQRSPMRGNKIYPAVKNPKKEDGGYMARGGQAPSYKETYFGTKWSKALDKEERAKPVGYRYTDDRAKKLGRSVFAKPTTEHIEKYLGNGVYFENRKDKSDISSKDKLAKGGQTAPQNEGGNYSRSADRTKTAKPVGYRFTDKLADKLGKSHTARPSAAEIEKYEGGKRGLNVYNETRMDKTDIKPKDKFEGGGEAYARGGQPRISNNEASSYAENHQPFRGNNLEGKTLDNGDYVVLSYGYYPIWFWDKKKNKWYQNKEKFSQTTARHISNSRPTYDAEVVSRVELDKLMSESIEGGDFMALGGEC